MLACSAYELKDTHRISLLRSYLDHYPDSPHAHRVAALIASSYYDEADYDNALAMYNAARLDLLPDRERDDMTYRLALCHLKTGQMKQAAVWLETLHATSPRYAEDCMYYLSYIRYTQGRYDEALKGFNSLQNNVNYSDKVPCYMAEIHLIQQDWETARQLADRYLQQHPEVPQASQMYRVRGTVHYRQKNYNQARTDLKQYLATTDETPRRDALYMLGLASYESNVYSEAAQCLSRVTEGEAEALTQNAYLHLGLTYLQLADKPKARMAFEQASSMTFDAQVKEQAAYNYALCIHETSYSAFGESVKVFENFLNEFPHSPYTDQVSNYLVEVYLTTRSYEQALQSIGRISRPSRLVLEAKQKILFQLGTQAFANARFTEAESYFAQSITLGYDRQTLANAHYWSGETCYRQGNLNSARQHFQQYLTLNGSQRSETLALAYYNLGYIAFHKKEYAPAENYFLRYIQSEQGENLTARADAYNRLGDCLLQSRQFEQAKGYYQKAEQQNTPAGDYACYQLALVAGLQKDYSQKVELLDRLASRYPQSPYLANALYEKGRSLVQDGNASQAIATFSRLLQEYPEQPVSRKAGAEIGLLYYQQGDYKSAIEAYKQVVTRYPGSEEARLALRDLKSIYVDADRVDEYAALANQLPGQVRMDANEQDSLTYIAAEKIYMRGEKTAARNSFERYLQSYPQGAFQLPAHYYLCLIGQEQNDEQAILTHSEALLNYPGNPYAEETLVLRATVHFNQQAYGEALSDYKLLQSTATSSSRRQVGALGTLRCAALLTDETETIQAANTLLAEAKLAPELQTEALYFRGKAYLHQGESGKALDDLRQIAKDTRTLYGAEAKYLVADQLYLQQQYDAAEKEILDFIEQSTPHAYWLARSFVLLADVYMATGKTTDARQYLLSLQQNYTAQDDVQTLINERLEKLKANH